MRCINCSGQIVTINGDLELRDKILGCFTVPHTEYEQCENCGVKLYSPVTLKAIEDAQAKRKEELLFEKPLNHFIPATEVAKILRCTRQAIHKHKRIRRGFIHFVKHNGILQYLKESVELFKKTGDGRLPLVELKKKTKSNVISVTFADHQKEKLQRPNREYPSDAGSYNDSHLTALKEEESIGIEELIKG